MRLALLMVLVAPILSAQSVIDGAAINSVTRAGIEGVSVKFYTQKGVRYETTTASDGSFHIAGVQPGEYRHSIEKDGFEPPKAADFPSPESTTRVSGQDPIRVTFEMTALTTLRGRVLDADGKPASGVPVQIRGPLPPREDNEIRSAADGSFQFSRLPPGSYTLVARPEPTEAAPVDGVRTEMVATYFPSSLDSAQAQSIAIRGTGDESGFEIRLRRAPVHRIRGIVLDEAGKPAPAINVSISSAHPSPSDRMVTSLGRTEYYLPGVPPEPSMAKAVTASDGTFEFPSIPVGEWTITANSEWRYEEATRRDIQQTGQASAFVTRNDVDGMEIHVSANFEFSASVIWPEDSPGPARWAMIALLPEGRGLDQGPFGMVQQDGAIRFERVYPGRHTVAVMANSISDSYVSAVQFGGRDVLGQVIELAPNPPPMQIVYKRGAGSVRAQFEKEASAIFMLIPAATDGGYPRSTLCDSRGPCELRGLRPGEYYAAGFDHLDGAKLSDPAYVSGLVTVATQVRVEENSNQLVTLQVNRWPY